jgi:hypothetical protein
VAYLIDYLGKFKFIFETVLGYVQGDQMGSFEAKKTESKISRLGTFKICTNITKPPLEIVLKYKLFEEIE